MSHPHRYSDPDSPALDGGRWVRHGLVWRWHSGMPRLGQEEAWYDEIEARRAWNAWRRGDRSEWALIGRRVHDRRRKRGERKGPKVRGSEPQTWDNRDGPNRTVSAVQPGPDHLTWDKKGGGW